MEGFPRIDVEIIAHAQNDFELTITPRNAVDAVYNYLQAHGASKDRALLGDIRIGGVEKDNLDAALRVMDTHPHWIPLAAPKTTEIQPSSQA